MMPPRLNEFCTTIFETYDIEDPSTFWACRPHFTRLLSSDFLAELLRIQLGHCLSGSGEIIRAANGSTARIELPHGAQLDVLLIQPDIVDSKLIGYTSHVMMGFASGFDDTRFEIERYKHVAPYRNDVFDRQAALVRQPDQVLRSMEVAEVSAGWEIVRFRSVNRAIPVVLLQSKPLLEFSWQYDSETLLPVQAICPGSAAYRLFYSTKLLAEVRGERNIETLLRISRHTSHFVRWSAMQALFALDLEVGRKRLATAVDDPHPRIRDAAHHALLRLDRIERAS